MHHTTRSNTPLQAVLLATLFAAAAVAGCLGPSDRGGVDDLSPTASLHVDHGERWVDETFLFGGTASTSPNGNITRWHFDFGDGNEFTAEDPEDADNVSHAYAAPGAYAVTLTVTDEGPNQTGKRTGTDVLVVTVHDQHDVAPQAQYATPVTDNLSERRIGFHVAPGAERFEGTLGVTSMIPTGASTVEMRLLGPEGTVLAEENVTVEAEDNETLEIRAPVNATGNHTLEIVVTSGGASTEGRLRIFYDDIVREPDADASTDAA